MPVRNHSTLAAPIFMFALGMLIAAQAFSTAAAQNNPANNPATQNKRPDTGISIRIGSNKREKTDADAHVAAEPDWGAVRKAQQRGEIYSRAEMQSEARKYQGRANAFVQTISIWAAQTQSADIPVLLPITDAGAVQSSFASGANYYDYQSLSGNGESLVVSGVCGGVFLPDDHPIAQRMRKQRKNAPRLSRLNAKYKLSQDERGHVLNFAKFSCSYELILNCPGGCAHESKLTGLAESLGILNAR